MARSTKKLLSTIVKVLGKLTVKIKSFNDLEPFMLSGNISEHFRLFPQEIKIYFKSTKFN